VKLLFVINPRSGRGKAQSLADRFTQAATRAGHDVQHALVSSEGTVEERRTAWRARIGACEVAVVFGGDGTVHHLLPALEGAAAAMYHVPMGTENLFARQFGMERDPEKLARYLSRPNVRTIDVGDANGRAFAIMCSAGPDAAVVRRLAAGRTGAIRHSSYVAPIFAEVFRPTLGPVELEVDGRRVGGGRGLVVIGNSPMYALGLNPARHADVSDGLLDLVFLPARTSVALGGWACRAALGSIRACNGVTYERGREIVVRAATPTPYQLDGDEGGMAGNGTGELRVRVRPGVIRVLIAPEA
jgi:diacylglycerol kinase (ATP)